MKMGRCYQRIGIFLIVCLNILFGATAYGAYRYIQAKRMRAASVAVLHKDRLDESATDELPGYYELAPNQTDESEFSWLPSKVTYVYNSDGIHSPVEHNIEAPIGTYRIAVLGDSFAFGLFVNTKDNFSQQLVRRLTSRPVCPNYAYEVINLGVPGYDVRYAAERYKRKGDKYKPNAVVWFLQAEDFFLHTDVYRAREKAYEKELLATGAAQRLGVSGDDPAAASKLSYKENLDTYTALSPHDRRQFIAPQLSALRSWRVTYTPILLIVTPSHTEEEYKNLLKAFALSHSNTFFVEVSDIETFHPYDYHPTANGHRTIANSIYEFFVTQKSLMCQGESSSGE